VSPLVNPQYLQIPETPNNGNGRGNMLRQMIIAGALLGIAGVTSPAAAAITINSNGSATITSDTAIGATLPVSFDGSENGIVIPGLTSSLTLSFAGVSGDSYLFNYVLTNTSTAPTTSSAVTAFGFNVDPNAILASSTATGDFSVVSSGQVSQGYNLEMCFKNGQDNNCAGSPGNLGVNVGTPGSGTITLGFSSLPGEITLSNYMVRYQAVNGDGSAIGQPVGSVPEPSTWAMMLLGFGAVGMAMRRSRTNLSLAQVA
jgi:hypothetical protein